MNKDWTTREIALLREHYPRGGTNALQGLIERSPYAMYTKAHAIGLRRVAGSRGVSPMRLYTETPEIDRAITEAHSRPMEKGDVAKLAERLQLPRWWVSRRARDIGLKLPRLKQADWSEAELELLHDTAHLHLDVARRRFASAGFERTETAIMVRRKRSDATPADNGYYTAHQIAKLLGVDLKTVTRWIGLQELAARKRGTQRTEQQGGDHWWIKERALRRFIVEHPFRIDLRKIPPANTGWFIELCARSSVPAKSEASAA